MARRCLLPALCLLALLVTPAYARAAEPGINILSLDSSGNPYVSRPNDPADNATAWSAIGASGAKTLRTFAEWAPMNDAEVGGLATFARNARARGYKVELVVTGRAGTTATPAAYARSIGTLAKGLKGLVSAYEIWNEPDGSEFWKDGPQPAAYTALLRAAYPAVKAADPSATVVMGGLVANDNDFLAAVYANGGGGSFDAVAVHTDTACNLTDPTAYYREPTGRIGRYAFTGYREIHKTMLAHGDDKPIWMSELGWSTATGNCPVADRAAGVSPAAQADFLAKAYGCLADDPYVTEGFWFDLVDLDSTPSNVFVNHFGLLDTSGARKPAFGAFQRASSAAPIPCGGAMDDSAPTISFVTPSDRVAYSTSVPVHVHADDDRGVKDINLYLDGTYIPLKAQLHGTGADLYKILSQAGKLSYGPHTLVAKARDETRNWTSTQITIVRVGGGAYAATRIASAMKVRYGKVAGRRMTVSGKVSFANAVMGDGQVELKFQRRIKGSWRPRNVRHRSAHKPFRFSFVFSAPGEWRVLARYKPFGPFQPVRLAPKLLVVR